MVTGSICNSCLNQSSSLHYDEGQWLCRHCYRSPESSCRLFEYGHENPRDAGGSTAHVRDIKSRRLEPGTNRVVRDTGPKTYFFKRGS